MFVLRKGSRLTVAGPSYNQQVVQAMDAVVC
ncbi:MAG: hypothetical protein ACI9HY_003651, partial [Planctomycetaceae bacterium]